MTSLERSRIMASVKSRDTGPERTVAAALDDAGIHYETDVRTLPGRPDFVIRSVNIAIFVHGCWWHGHDCNRGARIPKTNQDYWIAKIRRNAQRDRRVARELRQQGWSVWTLWACRLKDARTISRLLAAIERRS